MYLLCTLCDGYKFFCFRFLPLLKPHKSFRIYYKSVTSTMASKTVVHNPSRDNTVFQLEDKSIILTTCDEGMAYGGDVVVIFTDRDLPVESASQEDGPRMIYANRHAVQDSNGEVEGLDLWPGRHISSILISMLGMHVPRKKKLMDDFHKAVESFLCVSKMGN